jgi:hypothetical protein
MPVRVRVVDGLVLIEVTGVLSIQEIAESVPALLADPAYRADLPQLVDLHGVTEATVSADQLRSLVHTFEAVSTQPTGRLAILATRPVLFGFSRMYEALAARLPVPVRVFSNLDAARAWLQAGPAAGAFD